MHVGHVSNDMIKKMVANQLVTTGPQLVPDQDSETVFHEAWVC
jgi:hypothetical protein